MEILQLVLNQDSSDPPTEILIRSSNEIRSKGDPPTERRSSNELTLVTKLFSNEQGIRLRTILQRCTIITIPLPRPSHHRHLFIMFFSTSSTKVSPGQVIPRQARLVLARLVQSSPGQFSPRQVSPSYDKSRRVPTSLAESRQVSGSTIDQFSSYQTE